MVGSYKHYYFLYHKYFDSGYTHRSSSTQNQGMPGPIISTLSIASSSSLSGYPTETTTPSSGGSRGLSTAVITAIAGCLVIGVVICVPIVWFMTRYFRNRRYTKRIRQMNAKKRETELEYEMYP